MASSPGAGNASAGHTFEGEDFSNNVLSDLAPLLTLFGEQVTKQFLSLSMGWPDNILFAVGPLGIMTILVSAIRVSGVKRLKAVVGRARESKATAEAELLSSTSDEVCEMWNGREIVRTYGTSKTEQLVVAYDHGKLRIFNYLEAARKGYLVEVGGQKENDENIWQRAPNLTLNAPAHHITKTEMRFWASFCLAVQVAMLVIPALIMRSVNEPLTS
jgi:hypothetical protein